MSKSSSPALWSTVAALPDYLLLSQTRQLARHEQALQILVLDHLREIEARRLHLTRGYGSLFDYVVHELDYTAAAAWRRIKAMRLCTGTGAARELLQDGKLNLSNAAQLQNLFERSDRSRGRPPGSDGAGGGLGGEPRSGGAPGAPASAAPMRVGERNLAPPAPGPVLDAAAREELVRQAAGKSTREVQQMLAEVDPELAQPRDRMRALAGGRWELKAAVDAECRHGLEKLLMLLSHRDPHLTLGGLVARLVRDGLDRYDPARTPRARRTGGRGSVDGTGPVSTPARRATDSVPRNVMRANGSDVGPQSEIERGDTSLAAGGFGAPRASAPKRHAQTECDNTKSAPVRVGGRRTDTAKRHAEAEHGNDSLMGVPTSGGRTTSPAKRDSGTEGAGRAPGRGGRGCPTSAAKRLAQAARHGALGTAERSPALERHLVALRCFDALPDSRSRYIPAVVRREVWRRDQGGCSYVDPHSGRRCGSRYRLEIDHIVPFALGGPAELSNLRVRCRAHHKLRHAQRHAHAESPPTGARRAPVSTVDPRNAGGPSDRMPQSTRAGA